MMPAVQTPMSPDFDVFSTPPTTPDTPVHSEAAALPPNLARRNSLRPSSLRIQHTAQDWNPDIVVDDHSPGPTHGENSETHAGLDQQNHVNGIPLPGLSPNATADELPPRPRSGPPRMQTHEGSDFNGLKSPCFVHSQLDQGASLSEWLRKKSSKQKQEGGLAVAKSLMSPAVDQFPTCRPAPGRKLSNGQLLGISLPPGSTPDLSSALEGDSDDEDNGGSLTKQLAETAVGVREMSKQLGRARIHSNIQHVLIVTKARDNRLIKLTRELALYLMRKKGNGGRGLVVYVDQQLRTSRRFDAAGLARDYPEFFVPTPRRRSSNSSASSSASSPNKENCAGDQGQLRYWTADMCSRSPHLFDFVVTLGGDGTVLFTSWLFQRIVPPVLPFALGSLGFLTNFDFSDHQQVMDSVIESGIHVNLRMRFTCTVYRAVAPEKETRRRKAIKKAETGEIMMRNVEKGGWEAIEGNWSAYNPPPDGDEGEPKSARVKKDKEIMCFTTRPVETFEILNDLVVDRGPSPYVSLLELFGDEHHLTTVQADGLTISTPTGSTAYSMSAGGSLVHPEIPAILITPLCPHTLSFRPMLVPDTMEVRICVPYNSRSTAWASFDGRGRVELKQGDHIKVTASKYPFPTVCADKPSTDWFHAISRTLKWNERERQKSFVVVEEGRSRSKKAISKPPAADAAGRPMDDPIDEDEEDEDDEEDETEEYDIDDISSESENVEVDPDTGSRAISGISPSVQQLGREKAHDNEVQMAAEVAARALSQGNPYMNARSLSSGLHSGIETPDRFIAPHPKPPPPVSARHVQFVPSVTSMDELATEGLRDHIHSPRSELTSPGSKIPKDRDIEDRDMKTPTVSTHRTNGSAPARRTKSREREVAHRAFAVWGQDESDTSSNASDADD